MSTLQKYFHWLTFWQTEIHWIEEQKALEVPMCRVFCVCGGMKRPSFHEEFKEEGTATTANWKSSPAGELSCIWRFVEKFSN